MVAGMALAAALAALAGFASAEVIVETTKNLRPFRKYKNQLARFGSGLPEEGLVGFLVVAEPVDACAALAPAPLATNSRHPWIALIRQATAGNNKYLEQSLEIL